MGQVKSKRRYDSSGRRAQARRNRDAVLDAAQRKFLAAGYAATTIAEIAREAGVSVEMVYKAFGGKSGLVRNIYERGLRGPGSTPAYERSDEMREQETDAKTIMRRWGALAAEVGSVVAPIRLLMRSAAASDPEIAALLNESDDERLERMRHHARFLADRGCLRDGVDVGQATDIMWACTSLEIYDLLVLQRGWPPARFAHFVANVMITALLPASR